MRRRSGSRRTTERGTGRSDIAITYLDTHEGIVDACGRAAEAGSYALDTEFHRERTYFPHLALMQLHWRERGANVNALIDPLAVDRHELADAVRPLLESDAAAIMHAPQQDLEILELLTGARPSRLFDCQLASGFLGYSTPSLTTLAHSVLGVSLAKGERLTDWLARPLTREQRHYAVNDVIHLPGIEQSLRQQLEARGRLEWALEACESMRTRPLPGGDPENAWLRIKEAKALKGESLGAVQALAAWREQRARWLDMPVRRVLPDLALVSIAQRLPRDAEDLARVRGVNPGQIHHDAIEGILEAVAVGRTKTDHAARSVRSGGRHTRTSATVLNAWVAEVSRREQIDPMLVATRDDVENYLERGDEALPEGWRRELVGDDFRKLVQGRAGLALDADGHLEIVELPARR